MREKNPVIYVYDKNKHFLGSYRSSIDLQELSVAENLPIESRFSVPRHGVPVTFLASGNINKAIRNNKPYKGLYFYTQPLYPGKDNVNEPKSVKV